MNDKTILLICAIALVTVQIINAVRVENAIKDIVAKIGDIDAHCDKTVKHTSRAIELATETADRVCRLESATRAAESQLKCLDRKVIDIIKRYINYKEPIDDDTDL